MSGDVAVPYPPRLRATGNERRQSSFPPRSWLGFVPGAARTVVEGLLEAVGPTGTIMMPAYSGELSDPAEWRHPPVPPEWIDEIRNSTPPYDAIKTPTRKMGSVAEYFRTYPGTLRSAHPQSSFAALGPRANDLVGEHPLDDRFGKASPLGNLVRLNGKSLLLGAPLNTNSLLYLALYSDPTRQRIQKSAPITVRNKPAWVGYKDIAISNEWFCDCAAALLDAGIARKGLISDAECHVFPAAEAIAKAVAWRKTMMVA